MVFHICMAADENYSKYAAVLMTSIISNIDIQIPFEELFENKENYTAQLLFHYKKYNLNDDEKENKVIFHLLSDHLKEETQEKFKLLEEQLNNYFPTKIQIHILEDTIFQNFPKWRETYLPYYRLFIPQILKGVQTALYLDVDMLVLSDLRALWTLNLENIGAAVVCDYLDHAGARHPALKENEKDFVFGDFYFNSGFLLMNLDFFNKENITQQCLDFLSRYQTQCPDQDALNYALQNYTLELPIHFDFFTMFYLNTMSDAKVIQASEKPVILHFGGAQAPWVSPFLFQNKNGEYLGLKWWEYANKTLPFLDSLNNVILKKGRELLIYEKINQYTQNFWGYLKLPFVILKIQKELEKKRNDALFEALKIYDHYDAQKIYLTAEFNAKFHKALLSFWYRLKMPLAIFWTKRNAHKRA